MVMIERKKSINMMKKRQIIDHGLEVVHDIKEPEECDQKAQNVGDNE